MARDVMDARDYTFSDDLESREYPLDEDILDSRDYTFDDDLLQSREYTIADDILEYRDTLGEGILNARDYVVDLDFLETREVDDVRVMEARARVNKAPAKRPGKGPRKQNGGGKPNGGKQNGGRPNGGRPNGRPNGGGKPPAAGRPNGGRQNGGGRPSKKHQHAIWGKIAGGVHQFGNFVENQQGNIQQHIHGAAQSFGNAAHAVGNAAQAYANKPGKVNKGGRGRRRA